MNINEKKYKQMFNTFKIINALTEQQSKLEKNTPGWETIETKIVEEECKLFNDLVNLELDEVEFLFTNLQILPMLGLHLYRCMYTNNYKLVNDLLSQDSKNFVTMMWEYWNEVKQQ